MDTLVSLFTIYVSGFCLGVVVMHTLSKPVIKPDIKASSASAGNRHIHISWRDAWNLDYGAIEYIILRKDGLLSPWREVTATRKMSFIDTNVLPGKRYEYKVCGHRDALKGLSFRASDGLKVTA